MRSEGPFRYELAGTIVASDLELPGLQPASGQGTRWRLALAHGRRPDLGVQYHTWRYDSGRTWVRFLRAGDDRVLVFSGVLDVLVSEARAEARCYLRPRARIARVRQTVANHLLPLLIGCDRLVVHAGAVAMPQGVLAFVGGTGTGKSTLVSYLSGRGAVAVADDALVIEDAGSSPHVAPWITPLRLGADTIARVLGGDPDRFPRIGTGHTSKRAVPVAPPSGAPLRLHRLYLLDPVRRGPAGLRPSSHALAIRDLMHATFEIAADDGARVGLTFDRVTQLVRDVPVRRLRLPKVYGRLAEVAALIASDAGEHL